MSTYTHRYIEIKTKDFVGKIADMSNIPANLEKGKYYFGWEKCNRRCIYVGEDGTYNDVEYDDVPMSWKLVKWWSDGNNGYTSEYTTFATLSEEGKEPQKLKMHEMWCDNGGIIRDNYISSNSYNNSEFSGRGFPKDMSKELTEMLTDMDYTWGHTYVMLSEWCAEIKNLVSKFRTNLTERMQKNEFSAIHEKLDNIFKRCKDPFYTPEENKVELDEEGNPINDDSIYYEDTVDYLWEEDFWDILSVNSEINSAYHIVDEIYGYTDENNIRIVYYLA